MLEQFRHSGENLINFAYPIRENSKEGCKDFGVDWSHWDERQDARNTHINNALCNKTHVGIAIADAVHRYRVLFSWTRSGLLTNTRERSRQRHTHGPRFPETAFHPKNREIFRRAMFLMRRLINSWSAQFNDNFLNFIYWTVLEWKCIIIFGWVRSEFI